MMQGITSFGMEDIGQGKPPVRLRIVAKNLFGQFRWAIQIRSIVNETGQLSSFGNGFVKVHQGGNKIGKGSKKYRIL